MSLQTMYEAYVLAGMTEEGALGMIGNILGESKGISNNVQDSYGIPDDQYIFDPHDGIGYGLCQWTHWERKLRLWNFSIKYHANISNEDMQVQFSIHELKTYFSKIWEFLCASHDLYACVNIVCCGYEKPQYNNVDERYNLARGVEYQLKNAVPVQSTVSGDYYSSLSPDNKMVIRSLPLLYEGCEGIYVGVLQILLGYHNIYDGDIDCKFDASVKDAVLKWQHSQRLDCDGLVGKQTWSSFFA